MLHNDDISPPNLIVPEHLVNDETTYADLTALRGPFNLIIESSAKLDLVKKISQGELQHLRNIYFEKIVSLQFRSLFSKLFSPYAVILPCKTCQYTNTCKQCHEVADLEDGENAFAALPIEILAHIASYLSPYDVLALMGAGSRRIRTYLNSSVIFDVLNQRTFNQFDDATLFKFAKSHKNSNLKNPKKQGRTLTAKDYFLSALYELKNDATSLLIKKIVNHSNLKMPAAGIQPVTQDEVSKMINLFREGDLKKTLELYLSVMNQTLATRLHLKLHSHTLNSIVTIVSTFDTDTQQIFVCLKIPLSGSRSLEVEGFFKIKEIFVSGEARIEMASPFTVYTIQLELTNTDTNSKLDIDILDQFLTFTDRHFKEDLTRQGILLTSSNPIFDAIFYDDESAYLARCAESNKANPVNFYTIFNNRNRLVALLLVEWKCYHILTELMIKNRFDNRYIELLKPLFWDAVREGQLAFAKEIINIRPLWIRYCSKSKLYLLSEVVKRKQPQILEYILATLNLENAYDQSILNQRRLGTLTGETALHMAIRLTRNEANINIVQSLFDMAILLIQYGINIQLSDHNNTKALDYLDDANCKLSDWQKNELRNAAAEVNPKKQDFALKSQVLKLKFNFSSGSRKRKKGPVNEEVKIAKIASAAPGV